MGVGAVCGAGIGVGVVDIVGVVGFCVMGVLGVSVVGVVAGGLIRIS